MSMLDLITGTKTAAQLLSKIENKNVTPDAVKMRCQRGYLLAKKIDGHWIILLDQPAFKRKDAN